MKTPTRQPIEKLSASVINKIAAGEVIERPASVVKELLENSLDAGATRIDITVGQGGLELVRITDNGCGIPAEELPLALDSHATSKLRTADDLFAVATLGFRGEALASIAEVSRLRIRSRTPDSPAGAELECTGGQRSEVAPCGAPSGTTIEVANLFYNTPVRRKFMRSTQTEMGHVSEAFTRVALAHPQVHFTLKHGERTIHDLAPAEPWSARVAQLFGRELAENLIWVESGQGDVFLWGYAAHPSQSRSNNRMQYLFLNGRFVRDRSLQHALGEAYRGLLLTGRFPIAFLAFQMPPDQVDVNVHPTKLEVRFQNGDRHYSQLLATLRNQFLSTDLNSRLQPTGGDAEAARSTAEQREEALRQGVVEWAQQQIAAWPGPTGGATPAGEEEPGWERDDRRSATGLIWQEAGEATPAEDFAALSALGRREPMALAPLDARHAADESPVAADTSNANEHRLVSPTETALAALKLSLSADNPRAIQVHDRYLVAETDEGVVIIDQHALHERVLYELLREKTLSGSVETQRLLVPEPVDLAPAEAAAVLDAADLLAQLGILVEPFGGETVLVAGYPAMLARFKPGDVLRELAERLLAGGKKPDRRDLVDELLHMMACKAAIKAGDKLAPHEIEVLLRQRRLVHDTHHCPHGRPTALVFTRDDLDKQFKRT